MTATFRPYLTAEELVYLSNILAGSPVTPGSKVHTNVSGKINVLRLKIDTGLASPAYVAAPPRPGMLESLGGTIVQREEAYQKQRAGQKLTSQEYQAYLDYVVSTGEATPEEEAEWSVGI